MSQSQAPTTDTQAVLQSMLQRLRLQPGTGTQGHLHHSSPTTTAPHHGQSGGTGTPYLQTVGGSNNIPADGLGAAAAVEGPSHTDDIQTEPGGQGGRGLGNHGDSSKGCEMRTWDSREGHGIPAWDGDFGKPATTLRGGEGQQLVQLDQGQEVMSFSSPLSVISSPTPKNNIVSDRVENNGSGHASLPVITPTGSGQRFPADTLKDANVTSFERRGDEIQGEGEGYGNSAMVGYIDSENLSTASTATHPHDGQSSIPDTSPLTSQSPYQNSRPVTKGTMDSRTVEQSQTDNTSDIMYTPRVYAWSMKPPEAIHITGSHAKSTPLQGNGGFGGFSHSKDTEIFSTGQKTANSTISEVQMKKRLSETKTRRWTQKIKDRWRERHGSLGRRGKDEGERTEAQKERADEFSPQNQPSVAQNVIQLSNKEGERPRHSPTRSDLIDTPPDLSQQCTTDGHMRSINDFEFGLGSFSLLEEILTGQEWARFLNPTLNSTNRRPTEQPASQFQATLNLQDQGGIQSSVNQSGSVNQWNFRGTESGRAPDFRMTPVSTDISTPVVMDMSESNHIPELDSKNEATQLEPMEHGHIQSDSRFEGRVMGLNHTPQGDFSFIKPVDVLDNLAMKSRAQLNRKRVHHSQERRGENEPAEGERDRKEAKRDELTSSLGTAINQSMDDSERKEDDDAMMPLYPTKSSTPPPVPVLRGVLRHSISQDSESSVTMETLTKKRRVEDARRVRFSEEIVTIPPIDLNLEGSDLEDSEEDSVIEEDVGMEQAAAAVEEVVAPAPRPTLPAWILALKRRKTGRKPRQK